MSSRRCWSSTTTWAWSSTTAPWARPAGCCRTRWWSNRSGSSTCSNGSSPHTNLGIRFVGLGSRYFGMLVGLSFFEICLGLLPSQLYCHNRQTTLYCLWLLVYLGLLIIANLSSPQISYMIRVGFFCGSFTFQPCLTSLFI